MKQMTMLVCSVFLVGTAVVQAQTVYEAKGGQGKVYSDRPLAGGKPVALPPLNVMEPTPIVPASPKPAVEGSKPAALMAYRSLAVVFPEAGGSVAANNATFEVRVSIDPPLQIEKGHAFSLRMDGRAVPGRYTATEMMIPPEFFGDVAPAGVLQHVLEVSVVDVQGSSILSAAPVNFQTRFVTVLQRPHRPGQLPGGIGISPPYPQKPLPKPQPKVVPEPVPDARPATEPRR